MRNRFLIVTLLTSLILASCTTTTPAAPTSTPTLLATTAPSVTPTETATPAVTATATIEPTVAITPSGPATCQVVSAIPTPDPTSQAALPAVSVADWSTGASKPFMTIIEYADFQDSSSAQLNTILDTFLQKYPDEVQLVYRHYPLYIYDKDQLAAQAVEAAGLQDKFWPVHNLLYKSQADWTSLSTDEFSTWIYQRVAELGLDADKFKTDMVSDAVVKKVEAARTEVVSLNSIYSNFNFSDPFLFINGFPIQAPYSLDVLTNLYEYFKLGERSFTECPPMTIDPSKSYTATLHTEKGDIVIELYADKAPWAVNSFVYLAENNWYDNSGFFRVIPGFVAQAGDPSNSGLGTPGYSFSDELTPDLHFDKAGVVGMANAGTNSNGSQFFITYAAAPSLDGRYTIFGQVTSGMDVLTTLRPRNPDSDAILVTPDPILSITIEVK
ncbi:MAG: peptidylprolyl isomerase [Anaerolineaceae bacterium]|nr:peptidylprolyl isomerase [Anaerolineaceae bacterium]